MEQISIEEPELPKKEAKVGGLSRVGLCWVIVIAVLVAVACIAALVYGIATEDTNRIVPPTPGTPARFEAGPSDSVLGSYKHFAVASDGGPCSEIGAAMLARGGSAVDAAIAGLICIGVYNTQSMGIGGGFVMTVYDRKTKTAETLTAREMAPAAAHENMYVNSNLSSTFGGSASGIPGEVKGYEEAHKKYGKLEWKALFEPTIKMCRDGFPLGKSLAGAIQTRKDDILNDPELTRIFTSNETGDLLQQGDMCKRPKLATTLETIANDANAFYNGSLASDIVADLKDRGGIITTTDMANYTAVWKAAISVGMRGGLHFYSVPPPASGVVASYILGILDGYNLTEKNEATEEAKTLTYHRITEAFKFAYAKRSALGDDAFVDTSELVKNMTDPAYISSIKAKIWDNRTFSMDYYEPSFGLKEDRGTAHLSVLAGNGDAVSVTSTVNLYFGSKVLGTRTGIIFNNEMDDFSTPNTTNYFGVPASPSNFIKPWKRPMSSMSPSIIVDSDGVVRLVVGSSGGTKITTSTALTALRTLWLEKNIKEAIDERRVHHQLVPQELQIEQGFNTNVAKKLGEIGHNVTHLNVGGSIVQGIQVLDNGTILANCDFRKGGYPDGY